MINSIEEIIIYESPDGGKTVYSRKQGEATRTLHSVDSKFKQDQDRASKWIKYQDIIQRAEVDPVLNDLLEKVELYYDLKYG